jgi:hypothetical protein
MRTFRDEHKGDHYASSRMLCLGFFFSLEFCDSEGKRVVSVKINETECGQVEKPFGSIGILKH